MELKVGSYNLWLRQSIVFYGLVMAFSREKRLAYCDRQFAGCDTWHYRFDDCFISENKKYMIFQIFSDVFA